MSHNQIIQNMKIYIVCKCLNERPRGYRLRKLFFKVYYLPYRNSVKQRKNDGILHEGQNNIYIHLVLFVRIFPSVETTT